MGTRGRMGGIRDRLYQFIQLRDMHACMNQKVNLVAVIFELGFPKATKGTDYCCALRVVDETHHRNGVAVNIFAENVERLPRVAAVGDVIHLSHVMVREHHGEVNAVFNKGFSSFALYKGEDSDDFTPYQVSSKFHPRDKDKIFVDKLRKWLASFELREDPSGFPMLRELKEGIHISLACKILHYCEVAKDEWFIFAWDGSDTPPNAICSKLEDEQNSPLPLQLEPQALPRLLMGTFPTAGSILRITLDRELEKNHLHLLSIGKWVKFVNMRIQVHAGLWHGVFTPCTKLRYTPDEDTLVVERQRLYDERILSSKAEMLVPGSFRPSCVTELVSCDNVKAITLRRILVNPEVTGKFKSVVRVVAVMPCQAEKICSADGQHTLQVTLEDSTARIHAEVEQNEVEVLFGGSPSIDKVTRKLNKLLGATECDENTGVVKDTPRNPPWVLVCVKSCSRCKKDVWGTRYFRIFDTKIVGDT